MISGIKSAALGVAVSSAIGIGGFAIMSNQLDKKHEVNLEEKKEWYDSLEEMYGAGDSRFLERKRARYSSDVSGWTLSLQNMPVSQARTDYTTDIIKATEDGVITDDEYTALEAGYYDLNAINDLSNIQKKARDIVGGDDEK